MQISLLRILLLRFFKKFNKSALYEFLAISLVRFFGYFCPTNLPYGNFGLFFSLLRFFGLNKFG
jgi:hypothetical protein